MPTRYERGRARQAELGGAGHTRQRVYDAMADIAPDLPRLAVEFAYGDIHARPGLDAGRRELVVLGALIGLGGLEPQIEAHVGSALGAGVRPQEIVEAIMQAVPYAGFPRALTAMSVARTVLDARGLLPLPPLTKDPDMELKDRHDIIETCTRMMWSVDTRDWASLPGLLAPTVVHDFTSIYGGEPQILTADEVTAMWSGLIGAFDATQHLLGNHLVTVDDGDRGVLTAAFRSAHRLVNPYGSPQWNLYGRYRFGLTRTATGWAIDEIVMTAEWGEGNKDILSLAAAAS